MGVDLGGAVTGDVTGTIGASTVTALHGNPLSASAPSSGQVLAWNGTAWAPAAAGGSTALPFTVVTPSGDTTGVQDVTHVQAAVTALGAAGGRIMLTPGTYYGKTAVTVNSTTTNSPSIFFEGAGHTATIWKNVGAGIDSFRIHWTGNPIGGTVDFGGAGVSNMTIDGSGATGAATGVHAGDIDGFVIDYVHFTHFNTAGAIGLRWDNATAWTEKSFARCWFFDCSDAVIYDVTTGYSSYEYCIHSYFMNLRASGQNGVTIRAGAYMSGNHLSVQGNFPASGTVLTLTGTTPTGNPGFSDNSHINESTVYIYAESAATSLLPQTIHFGASGNVLQNCVGGLRFKTGFFSPSNAASSQFSFGGIVMGDTALVAANNAPSGWL